MSDLKSLMDHIAQVWNCNPECYPELAGKNAEQRRYHLLKHSHLHISKTAGKIAAVLEDYDHNGHGKPADNAILETAAVAMFVNALKFAEEVGLSAEALLERAPS